MLKERQLAIKAKGFDMREGGVFRSSDPEGDLFGFETHDYSKMKVGLRTLDDAILKIGTYQRVNSQFGNKEFVLRAIYQHNYAQMRDISDYFYESSGIYYRLCRYLAYMYRYDWYITPFCLDTSKENADKMMKDFANALRYLDRSEVKRVCGDIALEVMKHGVYYGYIVDFGDRFAIQQLPSSYCRNRFYSGPDPIVELNLQFFDACFTNPLYKVQVLKLFPQDVQQAYIKYKEGKLKGDYPGDKTCWYMLDPATSVKICMNDSEFPPLVGVIPSIIDLDAAQELDRKKTMQQLLKIIIQKLPLDKNGDLIFDVDEAKDIHNNAVAMLRRAIGVDVLTTFADIDVADMRDKNSTTTSDDLEKVERTVYNNSGISQNLFNADGNLATTNSILTDEASIRDLMLRFQSLFNRIVNKFARRNHYDFEFTFLDTTQYNYKEMSKYYKEHATIGYPKILPQVALGHSQSSILATIEFENNVLHLAESMIPPLSSNNISKNQVLNGQGNYPNSQNQQTSKTASTGTSGQAGRPEKEASQKSDKTIANNEAAQ